jgi:hypothetical protein
MEKHPDSSRYVGVDDSLDHGLHAPAAFEFYRLRPALFQQPPGVAHGVCRAGLVAHERQVSNQKCPRSRARDGFEVVDDLLQRHRYGVFVAQYHHPQAVADENDVDTRAIHDKRRLVIIGGQHGDLPRAPFHVEERLDGDFVFAVHFVSHEGT